MALIDITRQRFGRLVVLRLDGKRGHDTMWLCECDCGETVSVRGASLKNANTTSCGCAHREIASARAAARNRSHGMTATPEYRAWQGAITRCTNPKADSYPGYGGRGITVCERWRTFENFFEDMGARPGPGYSLDRIEVNGNYEPGNCRWATRSEQMRNTRRTRFLDTPFGALPITDAAERVGLTTRALKFRLAKGWSIHDAVTKPPRKQKHPKRRPLSPLPEPPTA